MSDVKDLAYKDYLAGMKYKDIAEKYDVKLSTVKSWAVRYWKKSCNPDNKKLQPKSEKVATNVDEISWVDIEHEYVTDIRKKPCSLESLSKKYGIPLQTINDQSAKGKWSEKRKEYKNQTVQKVLEKSSEKDADRITRLLCIADLASQKAEQALAEIESYTVKNKKKTKTVEYKDATAVGKPTKEVVEETEKIETVKGPVDRQGLLFVTNSLKNIKELYGVDLANEKQKAEIAILMDKVKTDKKDKVAENLSSLAEIIMNSRENRNLEDYE